MQVSGQAMAVKTAVKTAAVYVKTGGPYVADDWGFYKAATHLGFTEHGTGRAMLIPWGEVIRVVWEREAI